MGSTTYVVLNLVFILLALSLAIPTLNRPLKHVFIVAVFILVLTAIFDSIIIWADIVDYDLDKILGVYIGLAPIEDFAYAIVAIVIVPAAWSLFKSKTKEEIE